MVCLLIHAKNCFHVDRKNGSRQQQSFHPKVGSDALVECQSINMFGPNSHRHRAHAAQTCVCCDYTHMDTAEANNMDANMGPNTNMHTDMNKSKHNKSRPTKKTNNYKQQNDESSSAYKEISASQILAYWLSTTGTRLWQSISCLVPSPQTLIMKVLIEICMYVPNICFEYKITLPKTTCSSRTAIQLMLPSIL